MLVRSWASLWLRSQRRRVTVLIHRQFQAIEGGSWQCLRWLHVDNHQWMEWHLLKIGRNIYRAPRNRRQPLNEEKDVVAASERRDTDLLWFSSCNKTSGPLQVEKIVSLKPDAWKRKTNLYLGNLACPEWVRKSENWWVIWENYFWPRDSSLHRREFGCWNNSEHGR